MNEHPVNVLLEWVPQLETGDSEGLRHCYEASLLLGRQRLARAFLAHLFAREPQDASLQAAYARAGWVANDLGPMLPQDMFPADERRLLRRLTGWYGNERIESVAVLGPHLFGERIYLRQLFPQAKNFYLFEPHPTVVNRLQLRFRHYPDTHVFACAVGANEGKVRFHLSSNDGLSSSLLPLGEHTELAPEVHYCDEATVEVVNLERFLQDRDLPIPDLLFMDVQGAEYDILAALSPSFLDQVQMIQTEASTTEVYKGAQPLDALRTHLEPHHRFMDFEPLEGFKGCHGNALFLNQCPPNPPSFSLPQQDLMDIIQEELLDEVMVPAKAGREILIWGTGAFGRRLAEIYTGLQVPPAGFVDNNPNNWGKEVCGLPVHAPEYVAHSQPYVVVGSSFAPGAYAPAIVADLESLGLEPGRDFAFSAHTLIE